MARFFQRLLISIPSNSGPLALANIGTFAIQGIFAILLLGLFSPDQVAVYFVVSQIAFFCNSLALSQSTTVLLVNRHNNLQQVTQQLLRQSMLRMLLLMPWAGLAILLSKLQPPLSYMLWVFAIAACQLAWYLAQAYLLRVGAIRESAFARVLPPLFSAILACIGGWLQWEGPVLLIAALAGFAAGALWIKRAFSPLCTAHTDAFARNSPQKDDRSVLLRLTQTLVDGLFFTGLAIAWQSAYGSEHSGWLLTLMRLMGFIPSLVQTSWQQVVLAYPEQKKIRGIWVALTSSGIVLCIGLIVHGLVQWNILPKPWHGLADYCLPMVLWHAGGCCTATFGHLPFTKGLAVKFSRLGIATQVIGLGILITPWLGLSLGPVTHIYVLATANTLMALTLCALMLKANPIKT